MNLMYDVDGREIEVTSPDRILFPKSGITKEELVDYYAAVADIMMPYMKNRLITMHRFPEGIDHEGFYHKDAPDYFPKWIKRKKVKKKDDGFVRYVVCTEPATLVYLAQQACITPHIWLSKIEKLNYPDRLIFDLDPENQPFSFVQKVAFDLKEILESIGLTPFVMTTGSKGMHVTVPLDKKMRFDDVRHFANKLAGHLVAQDSAHLTLEMRKEKRRGRLFIDTLRNAYGATGVAPYAVRSREGAPVATPLYWDEVGKKTLKADKYTIKNIFSRLARGGDPWSGIDIYSGSVKKASWMFDRLTRQS